MEKRRTKSNGSKHE